MQEIVIKLDEKLYNYMQTEEYDEHLENRFDYMVRFAIKHGTPLPKGHGRLVEAKEVINSMFAGKTIDDVPTIIEADRENNNERTE